jgi:hypothetical protein
MSPRLARAVCFVQSERAIVTPKRGAVTGVGTTKTRLGNSEMAPIFDELAKAGWLLEPTNATRVKCIGPANEGPVFVSVRAMGREVNNQKRNLRQHGFVFAGDKPKEQEEEEVVASAARGLELAVSNGRVLTDGDLPPALDQMLTALRSTMRNELDAAAHAVETEQWEQLYQEEAAKVARLEKEIEALTKRAEKAESRWKELQALLRKD